MIQFSKTVFREHWPNHIFKCKTHHIIKYSYQTGPYFSNNTVHTMEKCITLASLRFIEMTPPNISINGSSV